MHRHEMLFFSKVLRGKRYFSKLMAALRDHRAKEYVLSRHTNTAKP